MNSDAERSVNLYPELVESGENASKGSKWVLYGTPGKQLYCTLSDSPLACIVSSNQQFSTDSVTPIYFAVSGKTLYSIANHYDGTTFTGIATTIGTVDSKGGLPGGQLFPAQIIVLNPNLLFVVANGRAWVAAYGSPIIGSTLNQGGLGYSVGDTGIVVGSNGLDSKYTVVTVSGTGAVLTYTLTAGSGYAVGTDIATVPGGAQPGAGDGNFTINITSVGAVAWALTEVFIPDGTAGANYIQSCTFMDNYVIVSLAGNEPDPGRRQFFISGLNDPSSWDPLDVGQKEGNSDPNVAVYAANEVLNIFGITTLERWVDAPNGPAFPFQRYQGGGLFYNGCASPWTICTMESGALAWLGNDAEGQLVVWLMSGNGPTRISNHAVEYRWRNYDVTGSSAYSYQENGHYFYVIHFPIPDSTWCCDLSTIGPDGKPCWHERLSWDWAGGNWHADIGRYHAWSFPVAHVVGDPNNGNLYIQSIDILSDNCTNIRRLRASPHIFEERRRFITNRFRLYMQTGTFDNTLTPSVNLRMSNDGGWTWGPYLNMPIGLIGDYGHRVQWYRTGQSTNRVYEITTSDPIPIALVDAFVELIPTVTR